MYTAHLHPLCSCSYFSLNTCHMSLLLFFLPPIHRLTSVSFTPTVPPIATPPTVVIPPPCPTSISLSLVILIAPRITTSVIATLSVQLAAGIVFVISTCVCGMRRGGRVRRSKRRRSLSKLTLTFTLMPTCCVVRTCVRARLCRCLWRWWLIPICWSACVPLPAACMCCVRDWVRMLLVRRGKWRSWCWGWFLVPCLSGCWFPRRRREGA